MGYYAGQQLNKGKTLMTDTQIKDMFDSDLNMTLAQLSKVSGRSVAELKRILLGGE